MVVGPSVIVLVHSPFLGPASLQPLADRLKAGGLSALVPDLRVAVTEEPVLPRLCAAVANAVTVLESGRLVLCGHSGAGPLLPCVAKATDQAVAGLLYLDAGLPTPGQSWRDTAPSELVDDLLSRAHGTRLPPWHRWFDGDPLADLIPDRRLREQLADSEPEVPIGFLAESRPMADWVGPAGYLQLSPPYASAADHAEQDNWPVRRIDSHHLAPATDPQLVADALRGLLAAVVT